MRAASIIPALRLRFPPDPPEPMGPVIGREREVWIDGLAWSICGDAEPTVLRALRAALAERFGDARLQRHYVAHERVGYLTYVRTDRDVEWLRLRVALLAERARLPAGTLRVRAADHDALLP